ncbi:MAG: GNAT family N-acetyltransferase [Tepidiformaceae bacterium]
MANSFYATNLARFRAESARELGCDESAFDSHALTVVSRPEAARYKNFAFVHTFGTGTVVSVEPSYLEWTLAHTPDKHFLAFGGSDFLVPFLTETERRGDRAVMRGTGLGFVAEELPTELALPVGVTAMSIDRDWRATYLPSSAFDNSLGEPGEAHPEEYWRWGIALVGADGEPIAVAGAYDDGPDLLEIGVDVHRDHRRKGLGLAVVSTLSRAIHAQGLTATYFCAASNVRSHRTALACGFVPVRTGTGIRRTP